MKRLSLLILLTFSLTCVALSQKQKGRYLSEVPIYDSAEYKIEMAKERSGIQTYTRIYQTDDSVESGGLVRREAAPGREEHRCAKSHQLTVGQV